MELVILELRDFVGFCKIYARSLFSDIDECTDGGHKCHANATCTNTEGAHNCSCIPGYTGNGQNCSG